MSSRDPRSARCDPRRCDDHAACVEGEPGIGKTTLLEAAAQLATGFRCLWVRGAESESVLAHAGLLQALGPVREKLAEIPGAQATALSLGSRVGTSGSTGRALPGGRGGAVPARGAIRAHTGAGPRRRPAVGRPGVGGGPRRSRPVASARTRCASSGRRGPARLPAGFVTGDARADASRPVRRRRRGPGPGSRCGRSCRAFGRRHGWQPARDPRDRAPPHRRPAAGAAPLPEALPVGDRLEMVYEQQLEHLVAHRPGAPSCCPRSTARAPRRRWPQLWPGTSVTLPPRWTRPRTAACWCVAARKSASAIPSCARRRWHRRRRRRNARPIALWRRLSPPSHCRSRGPGTEPKLPPAPTRSSPPTSYGPRTRAGADRGTPPRRPRWSELRCSPTMPP